MLTNYSNLSDKDKKKFEQSIKAMYIILGLAVIFFYVLPFACMFTGNLAQVLVPMILLNVNTIFVPALYILRNIISVYLFRWHLQYSTYQR